MLRECRLELDLFQRSGERLYGLGLVKRQRRELDRLARLQIHFERGVLQDRLDRQVGQDLGFRLEHGRRSGRQLRLDGLGRQHLHLVERIGLRAIYSDDRVIAVKDRGLFGQRIAQCFQAFFGNVENGIALCRVVFAQAFEVILDAGDRVRKGIEALPVGNRLAGQQLLPDVSVAGFEQRSGARQGNHGKAATGLGQQLGYPRQVIVVPLRGDELDDRVLGLLQAIARFLDHQLVDLRHVGGGQVIFFAASALGLAADHTGQCRLDVQQSARDIHQDRIVGVALAAGQGLDDGMLVENDFARLTKAQHGEGVGNLLERNQQATEFAQGLAIAAHEQIEAILDPHQLFAEGRNHRTHGATVRASQLSALLVDHFGIRQRLVEPVALLEGLDARRVGFRLGHVEQQVLGQLFGCRLVDAVGPLLDQTLELLVDLAQQGTHRGAVADAAAGQAFDHAGGDLPERSERSLLAQGLQAREDACHVVEIRRQVLITDDTHQSHLQHLPQLAQERCKLGRTQGRKRVGRQRGHLATEIRREQAGFREQLLAPRRAQIVEQRQNDHGQVAACALDPIQVDRHLENGLHHHFQCFVLVSDPPFHQRSSELLHLFGKHRRAVELDHLQGAMHLMHVRQAKTHARRVLRVLDERFKRLARLPQRLGNFAFHPLQGDIIVPITHSDSAHKLFRVKARTWSLATGTKSGCRQSTTSPTPTTSSPPGARRSARRLRISRRRQRRK